jgi:hypothetical protein
VEKVVATQPVNEFPAFYATRWFITAFTRAYHWSQSWVRWIQSTISHPISLRTILLSSYHFLPNDSSLQVYQKSIVCISHISHAYYMPRPPHPPLFDHSNNIWWNVEVMKLPTIQSSPVSGHLHIFLLLRSFQSIRSNARPRVTFRNKPVSYGEKLLAPHANHNLKDSPLSVVRNCLCNVFSATLHIKDAPHHRDRDVHSRNFFRYSEY